MDNNGHISTHELQAALKACGEDVPGYKVRDYIKEFDRNHNGTLEFNEFVEVSLFYWLNQKVLQVNIERAKFLIYLNCNFAHNQSIVFDLKSQISNLFG